MLKDRLDFGLKEWWIVMGSLRDSYEADYNYALSVHHSRICAPGRRLKAALIRVYVAFLSAGQAMFDKYGEKADPWMTLIRSHAKNHPLHPAT